MDHLFLGNDVPSLSRINTSTPLPRVHGLAPQADERTEGECVVVARS